jgi:hypothetical protein
MSIVGVPLGRKEMRGRYIIPDPLLVSRSALKEWGEYLIWRHNDNQLTRFAELNQFLIGLGHTPKVIETARVNKKVVPIGLTWISDDTLTRWEWSLQFRVREPGRKRSDSIPELLPEQIEQMDTAYIAKYLFNIDFKQQRKMIRERKSLRDRYPQLQERAV